MSFRSSGWLWGLLWFAAGAAVGFFANWGVTPPAPLSTPIERVESTGEYTKTSAHLAVLVAPESAVSGGSTPAPIHIVTGREPTTTSGESLFAGVGWIEIQPDERLTNALVYVLPARADGVDDLDLTLHESMHFERPTRIIVPKPGRYDVGLQLRQRGVVLMRNVEVLAGQTTPLTFAPPPIGYVSLEFTGIPLPDHATVSVRFLPIEPKNAMRFPGRNQQPQIGPVTHVVRKATRVAVPARLSFRVKATPYGYYVSPAHGKRKNLRTREFAVRVSAAKAREGDVVTFDVQRRCALRVTTQSDRAPGFLFLVLHRDGQRFNRVSVGTQLHRAPDARLWASPGPATLRWWGKGWISGSAPVDFAEGREAHVFIQPVRGAPAAAPQAAPQTARPKERVDTWIRASTKHAESEDELQASAIYSNDGETQAENWMGGPAELRIEKDEFRSPVWVVRGNYVADRVAIRQGSTHDVALTEGGFLLISFEGPFPLDFEKRRISLRRKGGGVLWWRESHESSAPEPYHKVQLRIGAIIGPLPAGSQSFEVRSGGVLLGTVTARVKAGTVKPLIIR